MEVFILDQKSHLAFSTDGSQAGTGWISAGQLEMMVHRDLLEDDGRGIGEPLNETEYVNPLRERLREGPALRPRLDYPRQVSAVAGGRGLRSQGLAPATRPGVFALDIARQTGEANMARLDKMRNAKCHLSTAFKSFFRRIALPTNCPRVRM